MKPPISKRDNLPVREVIAVFGQPKVGKSTCWRVIAEYEKKTGSESQMYVINTDGDAANRLLSGSADLTNVKILQAHNWKQFQVASRICKEEAKQGDWIVIDLADRPWKQVQNYWYETVLNPDSEQDVSDYLLAKRAEWEGMKKGQPQRTSVEGWDWSYVNGQYDNYCASLILETPAHVFTVTTMADMSSDLEQDKVKRMMFGKVGVKMTGQKDLPYQVGTILFMEIVAGKRVLTTIGDRDGPNGQRQYLQQNELKDFASTYLLGIAGWQLS